MDESGAIVAFFYEDRAGWQVELTGTAPIELDAAFIMKL